MPDTGGESLSARKAALREAMRRRRGQVTADWAAEASAQLAGRVLALPEMRDARVVMGYLAMPGEASVDGVLERLVKAGVRVCVPAPHGQPREYDPAWLPPAGDMGHGQWGIREPLHPDWVGDATIDVVLVPGLAFDASGGRLGHGRGFYDRMLARLGRRARCRVGVAFGFQVVEAVPCGVGDLGMDAVVVETGVFRCGPGGR